MYIVRLVSFNETLKKKQYCIIQILDLSEYYIYRIENQGIF